MTDVVAGLITGERAVEFRTFEVGRPPAGCVVVDIALCGICGTEIASFRTGHIHSPAVCGHEWVGVVSEIGPDVTGFVPGDRVVVGVPPACGHCAECRRGLADFCHTVSYIARGRDPLAAAYGGFASRLTVSSARVVLAHPALRDEEAAQVEPAAVAFHAVRRSRIMLGDTVVVQGAGPIGLFALQFAGAAGATEVIVVEPSERRRTLAIDLGATHAIAPDDALQFVRDRTDGVGADVVLECAGVPSLLQNAIDLTRAGGTMSLLSFLAQRASIDCATWLARQLTLVASNAFTHDDLRRTMAMLADGRVRAAPLHTSTVPLTELETTLQTLAEGAGDDVKVLVDPREKSSTS